MPRRKKGLLGLKVRTETIHSIVAIFFILLGVLVVLSFTGKGALLAWLNAILISNVGLSVLLLPFIFVSAGLVMLRTKWTWSQPHVLLGSVLVMFGAMGLLRTGEIGETTFQNMALLITPAGSYTLFGGILLAGGLIICQLSIGEIMEMIGTMGAQHSVTPETEPETEKKSLLNFPKLQLPFGNKPGFNINEGTEILEEAGDPGTHALAHTLPTPPAAGDVPPPVGELSSDTFTPSTSQLIWEYPPLSLLEESEGGEADRGDVKKNATTIENTLE
ncbi:hypothetical protein KA082_03330, partial [Candidatus Woesebacteria bacterium]|nr:hypothetical protein [Candidatus Woesebacteria bacterium]